MQQTKTTSNIPRGSKRACKGRGRKASARK